MIWYGLAAFYAVIIGMGISMGVVGARYDRAVARDCAELEKKE